MNRIIITSIVLLISSCQVFKKGGNFSKNKFNSIHIHANTNIAQNSINGLKVKTKINIFRDSIVLSASPILGIEVFKLSLTNEMIYIDDKLQNKRDSLAILEIDPRFKLKTIKKLIINTSLKRDTMRYENTYITSLFTDYVNKENLFLPQKIIFWTHEKNQEFPLEQIIEIDYKHIKYDY